MIRTGLQCTRRLGLLRQFTNRSWSSTGRIEPWVPSKSVHRQQHVRTKKDESNLSALFKPVPVKPAPNDDSQVGAELCGQLDKGELLKLLNRFTQKRETKLLCQENGLDSN